MKPGPFAPTHLAGLIQLKMSTSIAEPILEKLRQICSAGLGFWMKRPRGLKEAPHLQQSTQDENAKSFGESAAVLQSLTHDELI